MEFIQRKIWLENLALIPGTGKLQQYKILCLWERSILIYKRGKSINIFTAQENIFKDDCKFGYRSSLFQNNKVIFITSALAFETNPDPHRYFL